MTTTNTTQSEMKPLPDDLVEAIAVACSYAASNYFDELWKKADHDSRQVLPALTRLVDMGEAFKAAIRNSQRVQALTRADSKEERIKDLERICQELTRDLANADAKLTALESSAGEMREALRAYMDLSSHIHVCMDCRIAMSKVGVNLCDEHRRLVVRAVDLKDIALSTPGQNCGEKEASADDDKSAIDAAIIQHCRTAREQFKEIHTQPPQNGGGR